MKRFLSMLATGAATAMLALGLSTSASAQVTRGIGAGGLVLDDLHGHVINVTTPPYDAGPYTFPPATDYDAWALNGFPSLNWYMPVPPFPNAQAGFLFPGPLNQTTPASVPFPPTTPYTLTYWVGPGQTGFNHNGGYAGAWDNATTDQLGIITNSCSGIVNRIPVWTAASQLCNSSITDNGTTVSTTENFDVTGTSQLNGNTGIGQAPGADALDVTGNSVLTGNLTVTGLTTTDNSVFITTAASTYPGDAETSSLRVTSPDNASWTGMGAFGGSGATAVIGQLSGLATIGAHNSNLSTWTNLYINPSGSDVAIGSATTPTHNLEVTGTELVTGSTYLATASGQVGVGLTNPQGLLSNSSNNPIMQSEGVNTGSFNWEMNMGGWTAAIVNNSTLNGADGLAVALNNTQPNSYALYAQSTGVLFSVAAGGNVNIDPDRIATTAIGNSQSGTAVSIEGATTINAGASDAGMTTIGNTTAANNSATTINTSGTGDLTLNNSGTGNIVMNGVATDNTTTSILTLDPSNNVRAHALSNLVQGIDGVLVDYTTTPGVATAQLAGTSSDVLFGSDRYINTNLSTLHLTSGAAPGTDFATFAGSGVTINNGSTNSGTTDIGNTTAGGNVTINAAGGNIGTIALNGPTNINTTNYALTTVGNGTGNNQLVIKGLLDAASGDSYPSPEWDLDVQGDASVQGILHIGGALGSMWLDGNSLTNTINSDLPLALNSNALSSPAVMINDASSANAATDINSTSGTGSVAIGNTTTTSLTLNSAATSINTTGTGTTAIGNSGTAWNVATNGNAQFGDVIAFSSAAPQLVAEATSGPNAQQLTMGYTGTAPGYGFIQAVEQGVSVTPLYLQGSGSGVGVGYANGTALPAVFSVSGTANVAAAGGATAITATTSGIGEAITSTGTGFPQGLTLDVTNTANLSARGLTITAAGTPTGASGVDGALITGTVNAGGTSLARALGTQANNNGSGPATAATFTATTASSATATGLTATVSGSTGSNIGMSFAVSGTGAKDLLGSGSTWQITSAGAATFNSGASVATGAAANAANTIQWENTNNGTLTTAVLTAPRTWTLPDANGTLLTDQTGVQYNTTGAQNTATPVTNNLFNVAYASGAGNAAGAVINSTTTAGTATGLTVSANGTAGLVRALDVSATGGTGATFGVPNNLAIHVSNGALGFPNAYYFESPAADQFTLSSIDNGFDINLNTDASGTGDFTVHLDGQATPYLDVQGSAVAVNTALTATGNTTLATTAGTTNTFGNGGGSTSNTIGDNGTATTTTTNNLGQSTLANASVTNNIGNFGNGTVTNNIIGTTNINTPTSGLTMPTTNIDANPAVAGAITIGNDNGSKSNTSADGNWTFSQAPSFSALTQGSVIFAGAGGTLSQNNTDFYWDATNFALDLGGNTSNHNSFGTLDVLQLGGHDALLGGGSNTGSELKLLGSTVHYSMYNSGNTLTFANTSTLSQTNSAGTALMTLSSGGLLTVTTGGASITGGLNNNTGGITSAGAISGATGITSSGTIDFTGLNTVGVVHNDATGTLSTGLIANADLVGGVYGAITGLGTQSQALDMNNNQINNLANPAVGTDAANLNTVNNAVNTAVSGTTNTMAKFTGANAVGNSLLTDDGTTLTYSGTGGISATGGPINTTSASGYEIGGSTVLANPGTSNLFAGVNAGAGNLTGTLAVAVGAGALQTETAGQDNVAIGETALQAATGGSWNTVIGGGAAWNNNVTGSDITIVGGGAGTGITTGGEITLLGEGTDATGAAATTAAANATAIGYGASVSSANTIQLGNGSVSLVNTSGQVKAGGGLDANSAGIANAGNVSGVGTMAGTFGGTFTITTENGSLTDFAIPYTSATASSSVIVTSVKSTNGNYFTPYVASVTGGTGFTVHLSGAPSTGDNVQINYIVIN